MSVTSWLMRAMKSLTAPRPKSGRLLLPRPEDAQRDYISAGLTPARLLAVLAEADDGSLAGPMQLFEEMEEKDAHLYCVANTRRLALTGLEWRVVSAAEFDDSVDRAAADEAADYCRSVLRAVDAFDEILQHLSLAMGRNLAVAEIIWDTAGGEFRPVDFVPVDFTRLAFDHLNRLRILTEDEPRDGIEPPPLKFIVHSPHCVCGHPQRGGLLRVTAMLYLAKNLALKDWLTFAELFGMPVRIARYDPGTTAEEKRDLLNMLESLGSAAAGIFSRAVELQFVETARGSAGAPYQRLIEFINREMSKAWLGQTLTTDISGQSGSIAASQVHDDVRRDLLFDDIRREGRTIRRDILRPMTLFRFGPDAPVPHFRRRTRTVGSAAELVQILDTAVNRLGVRVPEDWAQDVLGLPLTSDKNMALRGAGAPKTAMTAPQTASATS
ncbi:MAG: DUF935 family protein [Phycisphaerae bacterium]|nr:DUF935 family protein [Phycisphaerae bacterium]